MIIDDMLHGYYIHGENPIGYAEGSSEHLANCLHYESLGKGKKRGYLQMDSDSH
jgi:meckelin